MSVLFPHNSYDANIINQPEIEYRKAKHPFRMRNRYKDANTKEELIWDSTHCPVCFWNKQYSCWESLIDRDTNYCPRCGQKINWSEEG